MTCIHGLDEINCPTCRILKSTIPKNLLSIKNPPFLHIENPFFKKNAKLNVKISRDINPKRSNGFIIPLQKPPLINQIPNFQNKLFLERTKEIDISKVDIFGISKRIQLESPEWQFEKED
ncbi:MAG: hypothetical protein ACFFHD_09835 [Promethearchaeota archaeon]